MSYPRFTHIARIYGIKCRYNIHTDEYEGIGSIRQALIAFCVTFDQAVFGIWELHFVLIREL